MTASDDTDSDRFAGTATGGKPATDNETPGPASPARASDYSLVARPAPAVRRGGGGAMVLALLSLVVAGAALTVPYWRPIAEQQFGIALPWLAPVGAAADPAALAALRQRLDGLGRRMDDLAARPASSISAGGPPGPALMSEIESLATRLGDLAGRVDGTDRKVTGLSVLADRIDRLAARIGTQETAIGQRLDSARTGLQEQVAGLSGRIDRTDTAVDERLATIGGRIEDATQAAERRATQAAGAVLSAEIGALDSRIDALESRADATANLDSADVEEIRGRVTAVEARMRDPALRTRVSGIADSLDALRSRLTALSDRIDALRQAFDSRPVFDPQALADLGRTLESRPVFDPAETAALRSADGAIAAAAETLAGEVAAIGRKVIIIQEALDAGAGVRAADVAMILAIGQMAQDVRGSAPFDTAFQGVEVMAARVFDGDMPAALTDNMDVLRPVAITGVPSLPDLRRRYAVTAIDAARRTLVPDDADFVDRTVARLTDLVMIRKVDTGRPPETDGARLARAESRLRDGNLADAVAVLRQIDGPAASVLSGWLQAAETRLRAETAIRKLVAWATDRLPDLDAPLTTGAATASGRDG